MFGHTVVDSRMQLFAGDPSSDYGYVVRVGMKEFQTKVIETVLVRDTASNTTKTSSATTTDMKTLLDYVTDSNCPDVAFYYADGSLSIFLKAATFAYDAYTRIVIIGKRHSVPLKIDADFPTDLLELFISYALKETYDIKGMDVPYSLQNEIETLEGELA